MRNTARVRRMPLGWCWALSAAILLGCLPAMAQDDLGQRIQGHLEAGEFAPALDLARDAPAGQRDLWLGQIARAQAAGGAPQGAWRSLSEIGDDRARTDALSQWRGQPLGAQGGNTMADFDSLIQLITTTVKPTTWDEVGGPGSIAPFPTGVAVDAQGVLRPLMISDNGANLTGLRAASAPRGGYDDARHQAELRKVSLPRLEKALQIRHAAGLPPTEAMQVLAGLERIEYVFVYPDTGDVVLAGPAGDWKTDAEQRVLSVRSGRPVVRLDDLVVVLRHMLSAADARFGCAITPTQDALARAQAYLAETSKRPIAEGGRRRWLEELRSQLGRQEIDVYGLDPRTRAARILVEADYRMKLVGMGLEEGVPGVESYLDSIVVPPGQSPPAMGVLRWWFTLNYDAVVTSDDRLAFAIRGQGVKVQSENERLTAEGQRVHTGESEELNRRFAHSFTEHFDALALKYPVYAELRNLFDLALVGALVREEGLADRAAWHHLHFSDAAACPVELAPAATHVETVVNHRVIHRVHVVAGVSGGVACNPNDLVRSASLERDRDGRLSYARNHSATPTLPPEAWWWD